MYFSGEVCNHCYVDMLAHRDQFVCMYVCVRITDESICI